MKKLYFLFCFLLFHYLTFAQTLVNFFTTEGNFTVQMYDSLAPLTTANFLSYVEQKYYDGVLFHRVIDDFMIQGGDGPGNPAPIQDEFDPALSNIQKTISMANSGPNSGNTQFFINLVDNTYLDYNKTPFTSKHPVFGIVVDSFEVVQRIGKVSTNISNKPFIDVVMDSVRKVVYYADPPIFLPESFRVSPSPINYRTHLELPEENPSADGYSELQIELKCFNQYGEEVYSLDKQIKTPGHWIELEELDLLGLSPGTYYLQIIKSPAGFGVAKFVVL